MSELRRQAIHVLSNAELRLGKSFDAFDDPEGIAAISPGKRSALLSNPFLGPDDEPARLIATVGPTVAGRLDLLAGLIDTPAGEVRCRWGSQLFVSQESRGLGLGRELLRASEAGGAATGVCAPSRASYPLYVGLGYADIPLRRFVLVRRSGALADRWLGRGVAARAATATGDALAATQWALLGARGRRRTRGLAAERSTALPAPLEGKVSARKPYATRRSAAWLEWVARETFVDGGEHRRALYLVRDRAGEPVAYFLVKARVYSAVTRWKLDRLDLGSLVDWGIVEPRAVRLEQVVLLALQALDEWGVAAIEVCLPPGAGLDPRRFGLVPAGTQHVMVRGGALSAPEARDPARWSVRPGDGDHAFS